MTHDTQNRLLDAVLRQALAAVGAERGTILFSPQQGEAVTRSHGMPAGAETLAFMAEVSRLVSSKARRRAARVSDGVQGRPALFAPLMLDGREVGFIYLDRPRGSFHDEEVRAVERLCSHARLALWTAPDEEREPSDWERGIKAEQARATVYESAYDEVREQAARIEEEVKVLRAGDINQLVQKAVQAVLAREPHSGMAEAERKAVLDRCQKDVDRKLAEAKRLQLAREHVEDANRKLQEKVEELNRRFLAERKALEAEKQRAFERGRAHEEPDVAIFSTALDGFFEGLEQRKSPNPEPTSQSERLMAEVKPAEAPLSGSLLLMAAQDRELPAAEMAALEDRMELADPILQSEWEWLARARAAIGAFEPARASVSDLAALQQRIEAGLGAASAQEGAEGLAQRLRELEPGATVELAPHLRQRQGSELARRLGPSTVPSPAADEVAFRARLEVDVARWIQHMPLPERQPSPATGLELAAGLDEAPGSGSNAWGFTELEQGELFAWILDASGRGVESACFLLEAGAAFRAAIEPGASPAAVLARVNLALAREEAAMFASALLVRWDPAARKLVLSSGGHEHAAVFKAARRRVELVRADGIVLGLGLRIPGSAYRDHEVAFEPGDALLLHTAGAIEVAGGAPEAEQRALFAALAQHGERSASGILAALREDLVRRHGPVRHDDRALVVIKRR